MALRSAPSHSFTTLSSPQRPRTTNSDLPNIHISDNARVQIGDQFYYGSSDEARQLLDSLSFPEIFRRYESIENECPGTFQWVLERYDVSTPGIGRSSARDLPSRPEAKWDSFPWWLAGHEPIYWISGKPGSGKSTLMKYIEIDFKIADEFVPISFWFWQAATEPLQKNIEGCLRSLICQLIMHPKVKSLACSVLSSYKQLIVGGWPLGKLRDVLRDILITCQDYKIRVVILLDGLDESEQHAEDILDFFMELSIDISGLKICMSSRAEQLFIDELADRPKLRLQDLNKGDILRVIDTELMQNKKMMHRLAGKDDLKKLLRGNLEGKAEGVLLWVRLAIRSLCRGLRNRDDDEILLRRLEELPRELDDLYALMLDRNKHDEVHYQQTAARYLNLISYKEFGLGQFCLALNHGLREQLLTPPCISARFPNLIKDLSLSDVAARVSIRTGGLLEVRCPFSDRPTKPEPDYEQEFGALRRDGSYIAFIHRTAKDYMANTTRGIKLASMYPIGNQHLQKLDFELALLFDFVLPPFLLPASDFVDEGLPDMAGRRRDKDWANHPGYDVQCFDPADEDVSKMCAIYDDLSTRDALKQTKNITTAIGKGRSYFLTMPQGGLDHYYTLCRYGWWQQCLHVLEKQQETFDQRHLSILLLCVLHEPNGLSRRFPDQLDGDDQEDQRRGRRPEGKVRAAAGIELARLLVSKGANLLHEQVTKYGESEALLLTFMRYTNSLTRWQLRLRNEGPSGLSGLIRISPSIQTCDEATRKCCLTWDTDHGRMRPAAHRRPADVSGDDHRAAIHQYISGSTYAQSEASRHLSSTKYILFGTWHLNLTTFVPGQTGQLVNNKSQVFAFVRKHSDLHGPFDMTVENELITVTNDEGRHLSGMLSQLDIRVHQIELVRNENQPPGFVLKNNTIEVSDDDQEVNSDDPMVSRSDKTKILGLLDKLSRRNPRHKTLHPLLLQLGISNDIIQRYLSLEASQLRDQGCSDQDIGLWRKWMSGSGHEEP